jgi:phage gpG-like protein
MIDMRLLPMIDETPQVAKAVERGAVQGLRKAAFAIYEKARESIVESDRPSAPGEPPHTRRGQLRRAIVYAVDAQEQTAIIGPRESVVGVSAEAHEFGGEFRGEKYPERPFMGAALEEELDIIPAGFAGEARS